MKRLLALSLAGLVLLTACSGEEKVARSVASAGGFGCTTATALAAPPSLPPNFPTPAELTFTGSEQAGPSTIVDGYWGADLDEVYDEFRAAFTGAGYTVTSSEKEEDDAEVNFSGGNTTGQVKLGVPCEGQTSVKITIRPA